MTLYTNVYVHDETDIRQVFAKCGQLIGATEGTRFRPYRGGFMNEPGQDLCAWLKVLPGQDDGVAVTVSFETAYSYSDDQGRSCGDLHADLVTQLGAWLDGRGLRWSWLNEFTGEIYPGGFGLNTLRDVRAQPVADR